MQYKTELLDKKLIVHETMAFWFKKPEGFIFRSGQTIDVTLLDPSETDKKGNTRIFSIVSSPSEPYLMVATRLRKSALKHTLKEMAIGSTVEIVGPFGSFFLHQNTAKEAVFLVGGVGITPFMSIIKDATERSLPHRMTLLYSNHRPEDALFLSELTALKEQNQNFTFVPTMTANDASYTWSGERGHISKEMLEKHVSQNGNTIYYSAGPEQMVTAMRKLLVEMGVSEDDIRTEEFSGYEQH